MKKFLLFPSLILLFLLFISSARALELTKIGTVDVSGDGIGSTVSAYTYSSRSFTLYGTATASSSVAIKVDDASYNATANQSGVWSTYLSSLTYDDHAVAITAADQNSLNFTLTISSSSAITPTPRTSQTTTSSSSSSALPASGTLENTFLSAALALFSIGLGVAVKYRD